MLSSYVDKVLVSFHGLEYNYKKPNRVVYTGTPVRKEFFANPDEEVEDKEKPLVVSFFGSNGAARMNEVMAELIIKNVIESQFNHIHGTGKAGYSAMAALLRKKGLTGQLPNGIEVREYIENMSAIMKEADLVISRAGASTIAELTAMGKPAILIPSPNVVNNHQEPNARQLEKAGGAVMLLEKDCSSEELYDTVTKLLKDKKKLIEMSKAQLSLAVPNATNKIVDIVLSLCNQT